VGADTFLLMIIDCELCVMRDKACADCVVPIILNIKPSPGKNAEFSAQEEQAINHLSEQGVIPPLRFVQ